MLDAGQILLLDVWRSQRSLGKIQTNISAMLSSQVILVVILYECFGLYLIFHHHDALSQRVIQIKISSDDVELHSEENDQHAGAVHGHDGAGEGCGKTRFNTKNINLCVINHN